MLGLTPPLSIKSADVAVPAAIVVAAVGGMLAAVAPMPTVGIGGALVVLVGLFALGRRSAQVFLGWLAIVLTLYAFLSRGGAYIGVAPVYIGEVALFVGLIALLLNIRRVRPGLVHWLLIAFMAWGAARTVPYIGTYGLDALRDGVTWAYGAFALAVAATIRTIDYETVTRLYRRLLPYYVIAMPIVAVVTRVFDAYIPKWPNTPGGGVGILFFGNGHTGVHLAGVGAFILLGLFGVNKRNRIMEPILWVAWLVGLGIVGSLNRGSLVAASTCGLALAFVRSRTRLMSVALLAPVVLALVAVVNPVVDLGTVRKVSFDQLVQNALSVFGESSNWDLEGTTEWRLAWWQKIADYTVSGPYFWDGKGYGINLADDDGFQVAADGSLRAPHNGHIEILARSGVPGLALWILVQGAYGVALLRAAVRAHRSGAEGWVQILGWLFIYWLAAMIDMSFDPYLQGPHGGILFWSLMGLGLGAIRASRTGEGPAPGSVDEIPERAAPRRAIPLAGRAG